MDMNHVSQNPQVPVAQPGRNCNTLGVRVHYIIIFYISGCSQAVNSLSSLVNGCSEGR